jgi:hypothetical protein
LPDDLIAPLFREITRVLALIISIHQLQICVSKTEDVIKKTTFAGDGIEPKTRPDIDILW